MKIRRPAFLFLCAEIIGILIATGIVSRLFLLILLTIAIFLYGKLFFENKLYVRTIVLIIVIGALGFLRFKYVEKTFDTWNSNIESLGRGDKTITGKVESRGRSTNSNFFILNDCIANGLTVGKCRCYFSDDVASDVKIGNYIKVHGGVSILDEPSNEGEFNQKLFYRSDGITFMTYANDITVVNANYDKLRQKIYEIKVIINSQIQKIFNEKDAGLFSAMVTGDKSTIDKEQRKQFSDNGIAHILAISGLHLSILGVALFELLRKKLSVNVSASLVTIFIMLYGIFIDASAASLRAITMLFVRFLSLSIGRTYDSKNTLYIIAFIFLMMRPYLIFNAGFQFSYVAIFALNHKVSIGANVSLLDITHAKSMPGEKFKKQARGVNFKNPRVPAVIILTLFLFPITIYHYFTYPLYSILLNLIVIPLMSFVLGFGLVGLGFSFINIQLGKIIVFIVHIIFLIYDKLCEFVEMLPHHLMILGRPTVYEILYFYVALFLIFWAVNNIVILRKNRTMLLILQNIIRIFICIILLALSVLIVSVRIHSDMRMTFLSIGQGDSILIESKDLILTIDGGSTSNKSNGQYILSPHLKSRAIDHIDYAYITHADADHTNGIIYLLENEEDLKIRNLILPITAINDKKFDKLRLAADTATTNVYYMKEEDVKAFKENLSITVLSPNEEQLKSKKIDQNEMSLTFRLDYKNHSALFTGDIGFKTMNRMLKDNFAICNMDVDVLKVPHHGSKNSNLPEFFSIASPKYSVFSYGKNNNYGHPNQETIDSILNTGSKILKTGESGQIDIYFDKKEIECYKYKEEPKERIAK
ncbi:MAG: DNA internalization-related competence protein ComEC/Rec2 [Lachnospiraceae bacterium]|nr:DNA internalization-related competence protein ComEC/Rec2 [Lachnospiraceae bacterium]